MGPDPGEAEEILLEEQLGAGAAEHRLDDIDDEARQRDRREKEAASPGEAGPPPPQRRGEDERQRHEVEPAFAQLGDLGESGVEAGVLILEKARERDIEKDVAGKEQQRGGEGDGEKTQRASRRPA